MATRSLLDQATQIFGSVSYDDAIVNAHVVGTAEAAVDLENDLNILRTNMKDHKGTTNWYDEPAMSNEDISGKLFQFKYRTSGFDGVTVSGNGTNAFDTALKAIDTARSYGTMGSGSSTVAGIILGETGEAFPYKLVIRDATTGNPVNDGTVSQNDVYGRLEIDTTPDPDEYYINFYSDIDGTETAYTFSSSTDIDLACVFVSDTYEKLPWNQFLDVEYHDVSGPIGVIKDEAVEVEGMTGLYSGLTNQEALNDRGDTLGFTTLGNGASRIGIYDGSSWYTGTDVEEALNELEAIIGSTTSTTYDFTDNTVLADNDDIYTALNKLSNRWVTLGSTTINEGASLVGIDDVGDYYTSDDVEGALQEIGALIEDVSGWEKVTEEITGGPLSGAHTLPGSKSYTQSSGGLHMDVYVNGQLLAADGWDYTETSTTSVTFAFTIKNNSVITYMIRK